MIACRWYDAPLGRMLLTSDGHALTGAWFQADQKYFAATVRDELVEADLPVLDETCAWLDAYFAGRDPGSLPAVNPQVTPFRRMVCDIMCAIPYGTTTTYGAIAAEIERRTGKRASARAVGGGVGHNPISVVIPCHRVVGSGGSLTGYAGGLARKIALLKLEGVDLSRFSVPTRGTAL